MGSLISKHHNAAARGTRRERGRSTAAEPTSDMLQILKLQRSAGNRLVAELLRSGQPKLEVGAHDDPSEREADLVARRVVDLIEGSSPVPGPDVPVGQHTISRATEVGLDGGALSPETSAAIDKARGGGVGMRGRARTDMESAFGRSFSGVRLHAGPGARELNDAVSAKAFTVGNDIFFRDGIPSHSNRAGRELLAHELTHTVQQGRGEAVERKTLRRMSFKNTNWNSATGAQVSSGGALGVLIVRDGTNEPVVVKAGESFGNEAAVAGGLLNSVAKGGEGWSGAAPDARSVDGTESAAIHAKVKNIWDRRGTKLSDREQNYLGKLHDDDNVMVFGYAKGREMKEILDEDKQTKKGMFGSRSLRKGSVAHALFNEPGLLVTMGQAQAVDIITSNRDRLLGMVNLENFLIDLGGKRVSLIDNINARTEAVMADMYRDGELLESGENGFKQWAGSDLTKNLQSKNFKALARDAVQNLRDTVPGLVRGQDKQLVTKSFQKNKDILEGWFAKGLEAGRAEAIAAMSDVRTATANVAPKDRVAVGTNLLARKYMLEYFMTREQAWAAAQVDAPNVLGVGKTGSPRGRSNTLKQSASGSSSNNSK